MPSGLIQQQRRVTTGRDSGRDGGELEVHRLGVAPGQDQSYGLSFGRTDGAEDVGRGSAEVMGSRWPGAAPAQRRVILFFWPMRAFVSKPDFYVGSIDALLARDACQCGGKLF
jgi:hypothetical protein